MWNTFKIFSILASLVNITVGIVVYRMNPERRANRYFLITSVTLATWLGCLVPGSFATTREMAMFWIRCSMLTSAVLPVAFDLLRMAIVYGRKEGRRILVQLRTWTALLAFAVLSIMSPSFLLDVEFGPTGFPEPVYGWGRVFVVIYWAAALTLLAVRFTRALRQAKGIQRAEIEFTVLGFAVAAVVGVSFAQIIPAITGNRQIMQLLPISVILLDGIIAYGIVTRRIMSVGDVIRRAAAYLLLAGYLAVLYTVVLFATTLFLSRILPNPTGVAHVLAAIATTLSIAPANGRMQRITNRLFISFRTVNMQETMRDAHQAIMSIGTLDELMGRFAEISARAAGTDRVTILLPQNGGYEQVYPARDEEEPAVSLPTDDGLVRSLEDLGTPLSTDLIRRLRPDEDLRAATHSLTALHASLAVGIYVKGRLEGILLLGPRLSGKIYGAHELDSLQLLCNQLGVAVDNAKLYTAVQNSKLYNDILLDSLLSGVIAVNADGLITICNQQAQYITGLGALDTLNQPVDVLPPPIADAITTTFRSMQSIRDRDMNIAHVSGTEIPIRLSSSVFEGHTGEILGSLVVINDMTVLKKLEEQVRRTDRLSSLGSLAAGMAHEIKNPLVSIKTFTQLLPEQYDDPEFREAFSELVGLEVGRIDAIVTRLLHFARPAKPSLRQASLHAIVAGSLRLVEQQLPRKNITLFTALDATSDLIMGDAELLNQAFVNFFLNAIEAMPSGGELRVTSELVESTPPLPGPEQSGHLHQIRLSISDTGAGIEDDDVERVFDPFFTTKSEGTGLGLSVAHGIIQEHGATAEVDSVPNVGTTFRVHFPLLAETTEAAT